MKANIIDFVNIGIKAGAEVEPEITKGGQVVDTEYGTMKKGTDSSFFIVLSEKDGNKISRLKASSSCGCTTAKPKKVGDEHLIKVKYDTNRMGSFKKTVTLAFEMDGEIQKIFFKLTGKVIS